MSQKIEDHFQHRQRTEKWFWFLIPIFVVLLIIVFNISLGFFQERSLRRTTESIINEVLLTNVTDVKARVIELYEEAGFNTDFLIVSYEEDVIYIFNEHFYNMFLGTINFADLRDGNLTFNNTGRVSIALRGSYENGYVFIEVIHPEEIPY